MSTALILTKVFPQLLKSCLISISQLLFCSINLWHRHVSIWRAVFLQILAALLIVFRQSHTGLGQCWGHGPTPSSMPAVQYYITGGTDRKLRSKRTHGGQLAAESLNEVWKWRTTSSHKYVLAYKQQTVVTLVSVLLLCRRNWINTGFSCILESTSFFSPKFKALKVHENRAGAWKSVNFIAQVLESPWIHQVHLHNNEQLR